MNILKSICKRFCVLILSLLALLIGLFAILLITSFSVGAETSSDVMELSSPSENTEKQLIIDSETKQWIKENEALTKEEEKKTEIKKVLIQNTNTIKLENVVPPIEFKSGQADIPENYVKLIRDILQDMKSKVNVRLHFVGHTDNVKLSGALKKKYINNTGLSRERAGTTAEYFQRALNLPPEAISFDGLGESKPVASNKTRAGKTKNRRVEVEVWYDEIDEELVEKTVDIKQELKRVKLCRIETVCKLRYKEGHSKRARLKNLVAPLRYVEGMAEIPAQFIKQLKEARFNLRDKANVQIKLIGHTDNIPLSGRMARIYGEHTALSKAQARRVALAVQSAMNLSNRAIVSDGRGSALPIASNDVETGRAANRRIEVEFWHDDALEQLSDEPQLCPETAAAEKVTRVYDPPAGNVKPVYFEKGQPVIPPGYVERLKRIMAELSDKGNVRIHFIGYTNNDRLDRRTAMVYGDDIGLSTARARRVKEVAQKLGNFTDEQLEFEGKGFVHSDDVVNAGFLEFDQSRVEARIVYDDLAILDDEDGVTIERIVREVPLRNPYSLNMMRISVDGAPIDDPGKSSADLQRCIDVELEKAEVQFKFDNLSLKPRLNVTAWPNVVRYRDKLTTSFPENLVSFKRYSNYENVIAKSEVRVFKKEQSTRDTPVAVIKLDDKGDGEWLVKFEQFVAPAIELKYLLRVYDKDESFDETKTQGLWLVDELSEDNKEKDSTPEFLVGYGENRLALNNIELKGGAVKVYGKGVPEEHSVWFAGQSIPVSSNGEFTSEVILPAGLHTVEVAILNASGNGELFLRDLELKKSDWFFVGIADITASLDATNGPAELITGDTTHYDNDLAIDGRLAFFSKGKFGDNWELTASADTLEGSIGDLFTNFMDKSPDSVFRRMDPDYYYPTFGDDSTTEEMAPTMGKFYLKVKKGTDYGLWGNFNVAYMDNNLAHVDRNLYGANIHYENTSATSFGEKKFKLDMFAAESGTIGGRDEFRGTGGSLYYLQHQDILAGSDRLRIEVRDKISGLVLAVKNLTPALDYDIDYIQGRILLTEPLSASSSDDLVVDGGNGGSSEVYLVSRYEYASVFSETEDLSTGGRIHYWLTDYLKLGTTVSQFGGSVDGNSLSATDITLRKNTGTWLKVEQSTSTGQTSTTQLTNDGGYTFNPVTQLSGDNISASASRIDASVRFEDVIEGVKGKATFYNQELKAGYSAPGLQAATDTKQSGGSIDYSVMDNLKLKLKLDEKIQNEGLHSSAVELDVKYEITDNWTLSGGLRNDNRSDQSVVIPVTQKQGDRTDLALKAAYDSKEKWTLYSFIQDTVKTSGNRETNGRAGIGGEYRATDKLKLSTELSGGDQGTAAKLGTDYLLSDRTNIYLNYALENERTDNGLRAQKGNLSSGFKTKYSDSGSIYLEEHYSHGDTPTGLTHSMGIDFAPTDRLTLGATLDMGRLQDNITGAIIDRTAYGVKLGYGFDNLKYAGAIEQRTDKTETSDTTITTRVTTLYKNSLKYQLNPNWRLIGKLNHSTSISSQGDLYNGNFTEAVLGYAYRPVENDNLNALFKYTYFYNLPAKDQVTIDNTAADYIQKSNILSIDMTYDLSKSWSLGGKIARRYGEISLDRVNPVFFSSTANLYIVRVDWHMTHRWDATMEARMLSVIEAEDTRSGGLFALYRHFGKNLKLGLGYNFTDFSDDLTNLNYNSQGIFLNFVAKM
ncbi:MAG: OmpA family protein [Gammaproteobacteria bacterium]|nr:OmpA family protein [Gammaproteobacteria bacterium]